MMGLDPMFIPVEMYLITVTRRQVVKMLTDLYIVCL